MASETEVLEFLNEFKAKLSVWGVIFRDDRGKNMQTLFDLDISPIFRENLLKKLEVNDCCDGPVIDTLNSGADMWVFGKEIKGKEIYIKITLGNANNKVICISFHIAENKMKYFFK